jgi:hypothetical protein
MDLSPGTDMELLNLFIFFLTITEKDFIKD